jgi:hypothetical protein
VANKPVAGTTTAQEFEQALEVFRTNVQSGAQVFYAYLSVHAMAREDNRVRRMLNRTPLFWNTSLGALQTTTFIALGRVFDRMTRHNLNALLQLADQNRQVFTKQPYPTDADFRRLKAHAKRLNVIYDRGYRPLRNKVFAHTVVVDDSKVHAMMTKTKVRELERLFSSLLSIEQALWYLLKNGHKPVLRPRSYSLKRMLGRPLTYRDKNAQERVVLEVKRLLLAAAERPQCVR